MDIETIRLQIAEFLATPLIVNKLIEIDLWSIVHFLAGMILIFILFKYSSLKKYRKKPLLFVLVLTLIYELVEMIIWKNPIQFNNFIPEPETQINQLWDFVINILGAKFQLRRRDGFNK